MIVFFYQIFMSGEINDLLGLQQTDMHWSEELASNWDKHGYCGTTMIGGDIRHDVPPTFWLGGRVPSVPPCGKAHGEHYLTFFTA